MVVPASPRDCTTGIPFGHHVASLLAMTWKFYPVLFGGTDRDDRKGRPYAKHWCGPDTPGGVSLREITKIAPRREPGGFGVT